MRNSKRPKPTLSLKPCGAHWHYTAIAVKVCLQREPVDPDRWKQR